MAKVIDRDLLFQPGPTRHCGEAIDGCRIDDLDLNSVTATRVQFVDCAVGALVAHAATFDGVDLRGAQIGTIDGVAHLRGTIINESQLHQLAPHLATQLGISVQDSPPL